MFKIQRRIKYIKEKLKQWNKEVFGNIDQAKKDLEEKIGRIQEQCIQEGYNEGRKKEENHLSQKWETRCEKEETLWREKSRVRWLKEREKIQSYSIGLL